MLSGKLSGKLENTPRLELSSSLNARDLRSNEVVVDDRAGRRALANLQTKLESEKQTYTKLTNL